MLVTPVAGHPRGTPGHEVGFGGGTMRFPVPSLGPGAHLRGAQWANQNGKALLAVVAAAVVVIAYLVLTACASQKALTASCFGTKKG